jgi:hypothetical protein
MGSEARCTVRHGRTRAEARVLLESAELVVRGDLRLKIPFPEMKKVRAANGRLEIAWSEGTTILELGAQAETWAKKIASPKSLIDKLGVKPGQRVVVVGIEDEEFSRQLHERTANVSSGRVVKGCAMIFLGATSTKDLARLATAARAIERAGAIWVVWPKGKPALREDDVRAAALASGLVDVKVAAFSATHSALKLVIPLAKR